MRKTSAALSVIAGSVSRFHTRFPTVHCLLTFAFAFRVAAWLPSRLFDDFNTGAEASVFREARRAARARVARAFDDRDGLNRVGHEPRLVRVFELHASEVDGVVLPRVTKLVLRAEAPQGACADDGWPFKLERCFEVRLDAQHVEAR